MVVCYYRAMSCLRPSLGKQIISISISLLTITDPVVTVCLGDISYNICIYIYLLILEGCVLSSSDSQVHQLESNVLVFVIHLLNSSNRRSGLYITDQ